MDPIFYQEKKKENENIFIKQFIQSALPSVSSQYQNFP